MLNALGACGACRVRGKAGEGSKTAEKDPTLLCCAFNKHRLYLFTRREPEEVFDATMGRDVFNEKPRAEELVAPEDVAPLPSSNLARGAVRTITLTLTLTFTLLVGDVGAVMACSILQLGEGVGRCGPRKTPPPREPGPWNCEPHTAI